MKHILPISRKGLLLSGVLSRIPKPQKTASFEAASMGKEIESPKPDNHKYGSTLNNILSKTQRLSGSAPSSEVYPPPSPSYQLLNHETTKPSLFSVPIITIITFITVITLIFSPSPALATDLSNIGSITNITNSPLTVGGYKVFTKTSTVDVFSSAQNISLGSFDITAPLWVDVSDSGCNGGGNLSFYVAAGYDPANNPPVSYTFGDRNAYPTMNSHFSLYYKVKSTSSVYLYLQSTAYGCTSPNNHSVITTVRASSSGSYTPVDDPGFTGFSAMGKYTAMVGSGTGGGTSNYTARWTGTNSLGTGVLYDNGTNVGIGTTGPLAKLHVEGQCVTGDTILRRRRRKSKIKDQKSKITGGLNPDEENLKFEISNLKSMLNDAMFKNLNNKNSDLIKNLKLKIKNLPF